MQHPIKNELQRIQTYMQKLRENQAKITKKKQIFAQFDQDAEQEDERTLKVDKVAAQRFLTNILERESSSKEPIEEDKNEEEPSPKKRKRKNEEAKEKKKIKTKK